VPYREAPPTSDPFRQVVVPRGGRNRLPTIEFENGDVIRDDALISDHFETFIGAVDGLVEALRAFAEFELRGRRISALAQPFRFWRLQFVQEEYAAPTEPAGMSMPARECRAIPCGTCSSPMALARVRLVAAAPPVAGSALGTPPPAIPSSGPLVHPSGVLDRFG
jgi:hypothetical protein